jgi:hypothetical protein
MKNTVFNQKLPFPQKEGGCHLPITYIARGSVAPEFLLGREGKRVPHPEIQNPWAI